MTPPVTPSDAPVFDLTGPLPSGTTVLEASAGTGKTFTIAGLVTRWVAETPLRLPRLLVVTFTRAATAELRDRVRRRLVGAADHLEAAAAGAAPGTTDPVLGHLAAAGPPTLRERRRRVLTALGEIDAATIATIHGFCQHVLDGLGLASDFDREAELVEDRSELLGEVVDDLLVSTYVGDHDLPQVSRDELLGLARTVVGNPVTALVPRNPDDPRAGLRLHLAERIRTEVARRAVRRREWSYDDLLTRLEGTLRDPDRGAAARAALRDRYRVALIDEFQDTDPVQWSIVRRAFADGPEDAGGGTGGRRRALVLIGDPKQAIYAFRGADVYAYLDAREEADTAATLSTSWRADADLLRAFDTLLEGATFGEEDIRHRPVDHAPGHDAPRLVGTPDPTPLRLRLLPRHPGLCGRPGEVIADRAREAIADDVAADVVRTLSTGPTLVARDHDGGETGRRPLRPGDLAVLVRSNREAGMIATALGDADVPAVINGVDSVFATPAATDWQRLLDALERPASTRRVRALALSSWIGWTGDRLATAGDRDWDDLHEEVHGWARLLRERGVATVQRTVALERRLRPRLLARSDGERLVADLEHLGELLHAAASADDLGPAALAGWLREQVEQASGDSRDERLRRLETDDDAVQILTIHRSKGLEFPVVYCPFLWSSSTEVRGAPVFHDDDRRRRIDVGGDGHATYDGHRRRAEREARGEELRLAYVAMTRAEHQVVAYWAPAGRPEWSALGRLLLCRDEEGHARTGRAVDPLPTDEQAVAAARTLAGRSGGTIGVATVPPEPDGGAWEGVRATPGELAVAAFDRSIDHTWRRTSYTALIRGPEPPRVGTEPDRTTKEDEGLRADPAADRPGAGDADGGGGGGDGRLPLADMPGGTEVGTLVHRVLEHTDFAAGDLDAELGRVVADEADRHRLGLDRERVATGLSAALRTPLGPPADGLPLAAVTRADRRDEVDFELPLDRRGGRAATVRDLLDLLGEHLPPDDPLAPYPERVPAAIHSRDLRGYLAGSIDLVLRVPGSSPPRFLVVDYKTNRLAPADTPLTVDHYRPAPLAEAMMHGDYPLQALLYQAALHRFLRWRLPDYDPAAHLGGALYLFLRGMAGPSQPAGVFAWQPPAGLVEEASALLHGVPA